MLGDWIEQKGWTHAEYGRRSGRSRRMISYFCSNKRPMQPEDIHKAFLILGITFNELYKWETTNLNE